MAIDAPLVEVQRLVALKAETTTGTPIALTGTEADSLAFYDPDMVMESTLNERQQEHAAGFLAGVPGARGATFTGRTEVYGSGNASNPSPGWADTLLAACGYTGSANIYSPSIGSASYVSLTIALNKDGARQSMAGSTGTYRLASNGVGAPVSFNWTFTGVGQAEAAEALLAYTPPTVIPPRFAGVTFTIGGVAYKLASFEFDPGVTVAYREDANNITGYFATVGTNRRPIFRCQIEAVSIGTKDWYADYVAGTTRATSLAIGSTSGNTMTLAMPAAQLRMPPKKTNVGGIIRHDLEFLAIRNSADNTDHTITFG